MRRVPHTHLFLLAAAAGAVAACTSEEKKDAAWNCQTVDVPMGETVRCTQSAVTADGPVGGDTSGTSVTTTTPGSVYECNAGDVNCPPLVSGGVTSDGTSSTPPSDGTSGATSDGTSSTPPSTAGEDDNGKGKDNGVEGSGSPGPDECSYTPDLPYCPTDGGTSDGTSGDQDGGTTCDRPNCDAPGQQKKNGGTTDGSTPGNNGKSSKPHYRCTKDEQGNKSCESTSPECAPGTHASACGACVTDGDSDDCVSPSEGGCWVTGGGFIEGSNVTTGTAADGHDNFGGNAKPMKDGSAQGHWNHVDHGTGNHAKGKPAYIVCRHVDEPGPGQPGGKKGFTMNQVYFGGPAEWSSNGAWESGYWFDVVAKDHGEPGSHPSAKNGGMPDTYHFTIRKMEDPINNVSGAIVYETKGDLEGGNIQMHPPNGGHPYSPMALPNWVSYEP